MGDVERRKHKRYKIQCSAYYNEYQPLLSREKMFQGELINISEEGALLLADTDVPLEELLTLDISIIGWQHFYAKKYSSMADYVKNDSLRVNATVRRVTPAPNNKFRVGVHFTHIKAQDKDVLKEYISKVLPRISWEPKP